MHVWKKIGIAAGLTAAAAVSIAVATPAAYADTAAQPGDAVGVGSDTLQNAADFAFDGAPGVAGAFNSFAASNRVDNVFATGDANGRAVYDGTCGTPGATGIGTLCSTTNAGAPNSLIGSVVLRAGTKPVVRPNGSGQGVGALIADSKGGTGYRGLPADSIQFARMSRLPTSGTSSEEASCDLNTSGCGSLRVFQAATDNLGVARVASGFDGPAGLSAQQLYAIYTCTATTWNQVGGTSTATIHPLIPQSGSGTRNFFLQDLAVAGGVSSFTPGNCVRAVQEHDPTGIYADPSPADAIEPFSQGKLALINSGYFKNGVAYAGTGADASFTSGAYTPGFLTLESGTPSDGGANYLSSRGLYFAVRQVDANSTTTPFEPGSTLNFVQALFSDPQSAIRSSAGKAEISAAGFTPAYADCGTDPTSAADCQ